MIMVLLVVQVACLTGCLVAWYWNLELVGTVRSQQHSEGCFLH